MGKIWKQSPRQVKENNLAIVRANEMLYELQLVRHKEGKFIDGVLELFNQKYGQRLTQDTIDNGGACLFELAAR